MRREPDAVATSTLRCPFMSVDQARVVVIGGGITGCSVAYHLALAGWTDVLLVEKAQLTAGSTCQAAGLVTAFNPSSTMMRFRRYSIELYQRLGVFETVGSLRLASSPGTAQGTGADGQPGPRDRPRRGGHRRRGGPPAHARDLRRLALRGRPSRRRRASRSARRDACRGGRGTGARGPDPDRHARDGVRAVGPPRGHARPDRRRTRSTPSSSSTPPGSGRRRSRRWSGAWIPSTPVDHQHIALKAVPGSELPRDMPCFRDPDNLVYGKSEQGGMVFGGYELDPRVALGGRRAVGARRALAAARLRTLRAADGRRDPALPVPRRRRGDPPRLPPGRDDPRREPAARATPGRPRVLGRGGPVAQRVRRWRRDRTGDGRLDHDRRPGRGRRSVPGVAVRRHVPRPDLRGRAGARDVLGLLPAPLPVRRRPGRPPAAALGAPRPPPGAGRGLRDQGRLGTGRPARAGAALAASRTRPGGVRLDPAAVARSRHRRGRVRSANGPGSST